MVAAQSYRLRSDVQPSSCDNAILAIGNEVGSGKVIRIKEISIQMQGCSPSVGTTGMEVLTLISAHEGGDSLSIYEFDSNNSLPAQVTAKSNSRITVTANSIFRRSVCAPSLRSNRTPPIFALQGAHNAGLNFSQIFSRQSTTCQGIVLREGEGLAWYTPAGARPQSNYFGVCVQFSTTEAGNPTYGFRETYNTLADDTPGFSLMNGTGSGVVIEVTKVDVYEIGDDTVPCFSIIPIDGIDPLNEGYTVTPIKMDSLNDDLPASIKIRSNASTHHFQRKNGVEKFNGTMDCLNFVPFGSSFANPLSTYAYYWTRSGAGPRFRNYAIPAFGADRIQFSGAGRFVNKVFEGEIVLRPGDGIAVVCGVWDLYFLTSSPAPAVPNSSMFNFFTTARITVEDGAAGGGISRARMQAGN